MKYSMIFITLLLSTIPSSSNSAPLSTNIATIPMIHDLQQQQKTSLYRLALLPTILIVVAYFQSSNIQEMIYQHPVPFIAASYLLGNFLIDTFSKHKKINDTLQLLLFAQTMNHYMLSALAIKNSMQNIYITKNKSFNEELFFHNLTKHTGYSFEELEQFVSEIIHNCLLFVHDLCINPYIENIHAHIYDLMKNKITIDQVLLLANNDKELYALLQQFNQNPEKNYELAVEKLGFLIKKHFDYFIKKNLHVLQKTS